MFEKHSYELFSYQGYQLLCLSLMYVQKADPEELLGIAGGNQENVFNVGDFDKLDTIVDSISKQICQPVEKRKFIIMGSENIRQIIFRYIVAMMSRKGYLILN